MKLDHPDMEQPENLDIPDDLIGQYGQQLADEVLEQYIGGQATPPTSERTPAQEVRSQRKFFTDPHSLIDPPSDLVHLIYPYNFFETNCFSSPHLNLRWRLAGVGSCMSFLFLAVEMLV